MIWTRKCVGAVLALLWLPATLHCALETAGLIETTACHAETLNHSGDENQECAADDCDIVESGLYKTTAVAAKLPAPHLLLCFFCLSEVERETIFVPRVSPAQSDHPPELSRTWQFTVRAAPLARAPSLVS